MRATVIGIALSLLIGVGHSLVQAAPSKCDAGVTKAAGKKVKCKAGVIAVGQKKGQAPDSAKLTKCEQKFDKACQKAHTAGDCAKHSEACAATELAADSCIPTIQSPSGAFLQ